METAINIVSFLLLFLIIIFASKRIRRITGKIAEFSIFKALPFLLVLFIVIVGLIIIIPLIFSFFRKLYYEWMPNWATSILQNNALPTPDDSINKIYKLFSSPQTYFWVIVIIVILIWDNSKNK